MNKRQFLNLYDAIYIIADRLIKQTNPCQHDKNGICHEDRLFNNGIKRGCCGGCKYLTSKGCRVKCLECKVWLCESMTEQYPILVSKLQKLTNIIDKYELGYNIRISKKEVCLLKFGQ